MRCEFGLCLRPATLELVVSEAVDPLRVCTLHVEPILSWGVPWPAKPQTVRHIGADAADAA